MSETLASNLTDLYIAPVSAISYLFSLVDFFDSVLLGNGKF